MGAGEIVSRPDGSTWRIDRVLDRGARDVQAVRVEPSTAEPSDITDASPRAHVLPAASSRFPIFMDLPLLTGEEQCPTRRISRWRRRHGRARWRSTRRRGRTGSRSTGWSTGGRGRNAADAASRRAGRVCGIAARRSGCGSPRALLSSAETEAVLNGANVAAIGPGDGAGWEVLQFGKAELVPRRNGRSPFACAGRPGAMPTCPRLAGGEPFRLLDGAVTQVDLPASHAVWRGTGAWDRRAARSTIRVTWSGFWPSTGSA
jgi:hypothetical protein